MKIRWLIVTCAAACIVFVATGAYSGWWPFSSEDEREQAQTQTTEIVWDDLIPDDFVQPENPFNTMSQEQIDKLLDGSDESNAELARLEEAFNYAPVVDELDGKRIKLAAYVTPLDFDGQTRLSEFLLVPYVGACMHTPPPPANQVVHAETREAIELQNTYEPIWAIGTLHAETVRSNLAESGYRMEVDEVLPYSIAGQ